MLDQVRILLLSGLVVTPLWAVAAENDSTKKISEAVLAAAEACDRGAAMPLDPTAKAPPVQFMELMPYDFDMTKLKGLQAACQQAWLGMPGEPRFELQWARVTAVLNEPGQAAWLVPQAQKFAAQGSAEANFLLYELYLNHQRKDENTPFPFDADQAVASLRKAGEAGHLAALMELMWLYKNGRFVPQDLKMAVKYARRAESAPPQGIAETQAEKESRAYIGQRIALMTLEGEGFPPAEQRIAFRTVEELSKAGTVDASDLAIAYIRALRIGHGTVANPAKARQLLEARVARDAYAIPMLADMLVKGEGGPEDGKRALTLLRDPRAKRVSGTALVLADILLGGKVVAPQPLEAMTALAASSDVKAYIRLAGLLVDYQMRPDNREDIIATLKAAADKGDEAAAFAFGRLKLSGNSYFSDYQGAWPLLKPLADRGNRQAFWLYAGSQYSNLDSSGSDAHLRDGGMSDEELKTAIDAGMRNKEADAFLLAAKFLRKGVIYPQDDQGATNMLINAANLGNLEAMVLLGNAYADGLGTPKNPRERLKAWRLAAKLGSVDAKDKLADAFTFDTFDKLMTLDEGVTNRLVLYFNGIGRDVGGFGDDMMASVRIGGMFSFGSRAMEAGTDAVADAVMKAYREAPAGLDDKMLVSVGKAMPDELRIAIERKLKAEGFYSGEPNGYFGPDVRRALGAWVEAKGPILSDAGDMQNTADTPAVQDKDALAPELVAKVRDQAYADAKAAKTDRQKLTALSALNSLARYGDLDARWGLLRNYSQARVVRKAVTAAEITRYGLDLMVARPAGMDKLDFEFTFTAGQIYQDGDMGEFAGAVLDAIRDDTRLQDPLALGTILKQFIFAPGACDYVLEAARKASVKGVGGDGCDDVTLSALIAWAKAKGPSGVEAEARKGAALEIKSLDAKAAE